jgi:hypothetical protein
MMRLSIEPDSVTNAKAVFSEICVQTPQNQRTVAFKSVSSPAASSGILGYTAQNRRAGVFAGTFYRVSALPGTHADGPVRFCSDWSLNLSSSSCQWNG